MNIHIYIMSEQLSGTNKEINKMETPNTWFYFKCKNVDTRVIFWDMFSIIENSLTKKKKNSKSKNLQSILVRHNKI